MPTKKTPVESAKVTLRRWRVMEVESKNGARTRHVLGHDVTNNLGRASSPIEAFDLENMTVTSRSGKIYNLVGLPGNSKLGTSAWQKWSKDNGVVAELDVTNEYFNVDMASTMEIEKIINSVSQ